MKATTFKKTFLGLILVVGIFALADYCELFTLIHVDRKAVIPFSFQILDPNDSPVQDVVINSFHNDAKLRSKYEEVLKNIPPVSGYILLPDSYEKTLFFTKHSRNISIDEIKFKLRFLHPDYQIKEVLLGPEELQKGQVIHLHPKE